MDRRSALATVGVALFSGCITATHHGGVTAEIPDEITNVVFERGIESDTESPLRGQPQITTDTGEAIRIEGVLLVGSGKCKQAVLEECTIENQRARFVVGHGKSSEHPDYSLNRSCTDDLSPDTYRVEADIRSEITGITAVEADATGDRESATTRFER